MLCKICAARFDSGHFHQFDKEKFCGYTVCIMTATSTTELQTRVCSRCKRDFKPSSRHKTCPKCRSNVRRKPCNVCGIRETMYERCRTCANKSPRKTKPSYTKDGYVTILVDGVRVLQHRHVMSQALGRPLEKFENVHHINGIRDDNRLENLELWNTYQPSGQRIEDKVAWSVEILKLYAPDKLV